MKKNKNVKKRFYLLMKKIYRNIQTIFSPTYIEDGDRLRMRPYFVSEEHEMIQGSDAIERLRKKSDCRFFQNDRGVIEVDKERWKEAQRFERRSWMEGKGLEKHEDRNAKHEECFDYYNIIQGKKFNNVIEVGCGPFTNIVRILKYIDCQSVTLLDPLIDEYLTHPNCSYENKQLSGFEKRVKTIPLPLEAFETNRVYDLVVVINVLEHCFSAPKFFERINSITAKNGFLIFHDKLISARKIRQFSENIYDSGHPLRVVDELIIEFLSGNYLTLFENRVSIPSPIGDFDSIYFIGRKIGEN